MTLKELLQQKLEELVEAGRSREDVISLWASECALPEDVVERVISGQFDVDDTEAYEGFARALECSPDEVLAAARAGRSDPPADPEPAAEPEPEPEEEPAAEPEGEPEGRREDDADLVVDRTLRAERRRIAALRKLGRIVRDPDLVDEWVDRGTSVESARAQVLERMIRENPPVTRPGDVEVGEGQRARSLSEYSAWFARRVAIQTRGLDPSTFLDEDQQKLGHDVPADLPIAEVARRFLIIDGILEARSWSRSQIADVMLSGRMIHAGRVMQLSTSDFPSILENTLRKSLAAGFREANVTYRSWTTRGSLPDFKTASRVKLSEFDSFTEVKELMPIEETVVTEAKETYNLITYGKSIGFSRQALINDDLGAFGRIPQLIGQAAARTVDEKVYDLLNTPPTMNEDSKALFADDHTSGDNLGAGALSVANLDALKVLMAKQKGLGGKTLGIRPRFLIVPVDKETLAEQTVNGQFMPTADSSSRPRWVGSLEIVASARLTSTTEYFLVADPAEIDTIIVAGLNTTDPMPETTRNEGSRILGLEWIAHFDAGIAALEHRGMAKSTGS